ncbi:RIP metalloprotease RseP [Candidatus Sumerlaeota bacterium]|nr:RIP metalloprotease RseP [Candidatus Sumerlaeota bacterium]
MLLADLIPLINLPTNPIGWLGLIVMFTVAVAVHELGHLLWAKRFGVGAEEFAIGFGKRLWWREWGGTIYSIRALPLGGFVKIKGMIAALEEEEEERRREEEAKSGGLARAMVRSAVYESSLAVKDLALWKRLLIFGGGVINNVILGFVLFWVVASLVGLEKGPERQAIVGWIDAGSPAAQAGLERGDHILSVNATPVPLFSDLVEQVIESEGPAALSVQRGEELLSLVWPEPPQDVDSFLDQLMDPQPAHVLQVIPNAPAERSGLRNGDTVLAVNGIEVGHWMDMQPLFEASGGEPVELLVQRGEESLTITVTPEFKEDIGRWTIGFLPGHPAVGVERLSALEGLGYAWGYTELIFVETSLFLWKTITLQLSGEQIAENVGGPVQIFVMAYQASNRGFADFLLFAALLNMILAYFNILPIPILDGGHCLINIIESVRRRPIPLRVLERIYFVFFALLIGLFVTLLAKDILANLWRFTG